MSRVLRALSALALLSVVAGCGGGGVGQGGGQPPGSDTWLAHSEGDFSVHTEATGKFRTLALTAPSNSNYGFLGFFGARIRRLAYQPDTGAVAAIRMVGSWTQVFRARPDGTGLTQLTYNTFGHAYYPRWSPDGSQILYYTVGGPHVINSDGTGNHAVMNYTTDEAGPGCWMGSNVLFKGRVGSQWDLYRCSPSGGVATKLNNTAAEESEVDYSSASSMVVFTTITDGHRRIITADSSGSNERVLVANDYENQAPRFSPDGWRIAFYSDRDGDNEIFVIDRDGDNEVQLTHNTGSDGYPCWSPDGTRIMYSGSGGTTVMNADGTNPQTIASPGSYPSWWGSSAAPARVFIGPAGADSGGADPPLGVSAPVAVVGFNDQEVSAALTVTTPSDPDSAIVAAMPGLGAKVVGAKVRATAISRVLVDQGAGMPRREIALGTANGAYPGEIIVLLSVTTGTFTSVVVTNDGAWTTAAGSSSPVTGQEAGRLLLRLPARAVYKLDAAGARNLAPGGAQLITVDADTGEVLAIR